MTWVITGSQKVSWNPSHISTSLWLDGSDASTLQLSGSVVSQWSDKSGSSRHATQATAGIQPTYSSGSVVFTADRLNIPGAAFPGSGTSIIAVAQVGTPATNGTGLINVDSSPTNDPELRIGVDQTRIANYYNGGYAINSHFTGIASKCIVCVEFIGNGVTNVVINGSLAASGTRAGALSPGNLFQLGFYSFLNSYTDGTVWHLLTYPSAADTRQKLEWWLASKEGLLGSLPSNHPYKTAVPVP